MGSYATLGIGRMEFDWSKNEFLKNHSGLYLPSEQGDRPYYYADDVTEQKPAYVTTLAKCKTRLELLGYTLKNCRKEYDNLKVIYAHSSEIKPITFDHYLEAFRQVDVQKLTPNFDLFDEESYDPGEFVAQVAFQEEEFNKYIPLRKINKWDGGEFFTNLGPYLNLRLLMENPKNLEAELVWRYFDLIEAGYFSSDEIYRPLETSQKFLVVTEGSSDTLVIENALKQIRPDIADYFYFVDMQNRYPFTGTGNMVNFAKGLNAIRTLNKIIFVVDNDTEGRRSLEEILRFSLPGNMSAMSLPDLEELREFPTLGPNGRSTENINGRAASIEAYLDLNFNNTSPAVVRWKNYIPEKDAYQGAIESKDRFVRTFRDGLAEPQYDKSKLKCILDKLIDTAVAMNESLPIRHDYLA